MIWKDAPVKPFRFNPKIEKEQQGKPVFVSIKAKFLPTRQVFGFDSLLSLPVDYAPKFFKASKKMKALALQESKNFKKAKTPEKVESDFKGVPLQQPTTNGDSLHPIRSCGIVRARASPPGRGTSSQGCPHKSWEGLFPSRKSNRQLRALKNQNLCPSQKRSN